MARDRVEGVVNEDRVAAALAGAASVRALRQEVWKMIQGLTPEEQRAYKAKAEALPPGQNYF